MSEDFRNNGSREIDLEACDQRRVRKETRRAVRREEREKKRAEDRLMMALHPWIGP